MKQYRIEIIPPRRGQEKIVTWQGYHVIIKQNKCHKKAMKTVFAKACYQTYCYEKGEVSRLNEADWRNYPHWLEVNFHPGVKDNEGEVAKTILCDELGLLETEIEVYSFTLSGFQTAEQLAVFKDKKVNPLIQAFIQKADILTLTAKDFQSPVVKLNQPPTIQDIDLNMSDEDLQIMGKEGILDEESGLRRGPLGLSLKQMQAIQAHFQTLGRKAKDAELEMLAQTWSEHCKHTIFASPIDDCKQGIYKAYIQKATYDIMAAKGDKNICVSVFKDNSGAIDFDEEWLVTDKVETHNSPSALDPYGGAMTGIVGVYRDCIGFGKGAKPLIGRYGFCFAPHDENKIYFRDKDLTQPIHSSAFIQEGVIKGVEHGGNCSGVPTPQGFVYYDERYRGKPLVFVGVVGLIPRHINGKPSHQKQAQVDDVIIIAGGRTGKDGIHGATFSSEALDAGSPVTAVQIGDPFTQKKLCDAVIYELRERDLYNSITDNGAGGLSSSIGEMAEQSGGCEVELSSLPLKYQGLQPWEIWISESQERMTFSVPKDKVDVFMQVIQKHDCEATAIGHFTNSGRVKVSYQQKTIIDLDLAFLHDGWPKLNLQTKPQRIEREAIHLGVNNLKQAILDVVGSPSLRSRQAVSMRFDHEVQGKSVLKPLIGKGEISADVTAVKPLWNSKKAVLTSQGYSPHYTEIDPYQMALAAIDMAVCNQVASGGRLDHMALMDNFCWCSPQDSVRLWQLKEAARACYDGAVVYGTPYISGKDSMYNDFKGFNEKGEAVHISIPPTLLISSLGVVDDYQDLVTPDFKQAGDLIYLIGTTKNECGGSEFYRLQDCEKGKIPVTNLQQNQLIYQKMEQIIDKQWVHSSIAVHLGGLAMALSKKAIGGNLGAHINLDQISGEEGLENEAKLFSQSTGRICFTIPQSKQGDLEVLLEGVPFVCIGEVREEKQLILGDMSIELDCLNQHYHQELAA